MFVLAHTIWLSRFLLKHDYILIRSFVRLLAEEYHKKHSSFLLSCCNFDISNFLFDISQLKIHVNQFQVDTFARQG